MTSNTFKPNTVYSITIPARDYGEVSFESITSELKYVDKQENLSRMTSYQRKLAASELYTTWEDTLGCISVIKIKDEWIVEEK